MIITGTSIPSFATSWTREVQNCCSNLYLPGNKKGQNNTIKCVADLSLGQDIAESFVDAFSSVFTFDDGFLPSPKKTLHSQNDAICCLNWILQKAQVLIISLPLC